MAGASWGCYYDDIDNGRVMTSSCELDTGAHRLYCKYYCDSGYMKTASRVYCAGNNQWVPVYWTNSKPCIPDDTPRTTPNATSPHPTHKPLPPFLPVPSTKPPHRPVHETTTRPGYFKDPDLEMNIPPEIFIAAVIGGIIAVVMIVFVIFFRAHKRAKRESQERTMHYVATESPSSDQPVDTIDDSMYRGIVQRIMSNANQTSDNGNTRTDTQLSHLPSSPMTPPPYNFIPPTNTDQRNTSAGHEPSRSPPYSATPEDSLYVAIPPLNPSTPPYSPPNFNTSGVGPLDQPPPYEESIKFSQRSFQSNSLDNTDKNSPDIPPPPYSNC